MAWSKSSCRLALAVVAVSAVAATAQAEPYVYVLGRASGSPMVNVLTVIDGATNTKGPRITLGPSNNFILPQAMAMSPDGERIYVINDIGDTISVVSTATNTVVDTWPSSLVGIRPRAVTVSPDSRVVYVVSNLNPGGLIAIDVASRSRVATVAHNRGASFGVAASPDGTRVYVMATASDTLVVYGTSPYRVIATKPLGLENSLLRGDALSLSPDGRYLYLPQFSDVFDPCGGDPFCIPLIPDGALPSRVAELDTTTNASVATTTVAPEPLLGKAYQVAVSPNGAVVYAPNYDKAVHRLSPTTHASLGTTPVSGGRSVAFSADNTRAYVGTNQSVVVIDTATHGVVATIPFAVGVDGMPNVVVTSPPPPPEPPSNLRATITGNQVALEWDASPSDGLTGYAVEGGATPNSVLAILPTGSTAASFSFNAPTGAFYVRVRAVRGGQRSQASNEIHILVNVPQPPSAPSGLLGLADGSNLALSWKTASTGGAPTSFLLDVSGALTLSVPLAARETLAFTGVPDGTYTFAVRAVNSTGTSTPSLPVTLTFPSACPGPPQAPQNFAVAKAGSQLTVSWDPSGAGPAVSSYLLKVTGAMTLSLPLGGRSIGGGVPPGTYNLSVLAVNPCGSGAETAVQSVTVP